jgi:hypothetical protein
MSRQDLNTLLAFVVPSVVGFIIWLIQRRITAKTLRELEKEKEEKERIAAGHKELLKRVTDLEKQGTSDSQTLALLKQEMLPMAEAMKRKMVEILTHPGEVFKIPDELLAQINEIGAHMPDELAQILKERETSDNPHVTEQEKLAAEALPILVRLAELEAKDAGSAAVTSIQLVSSTAKSSETKRTEEGGE